MTGKRDDMEYCPNATCGKPIGPVAKAILPEELRTCRACKAALVKRHDSHGWRMRATLKGGTAP